MTPENIITGLRILLVIVAAIGVIALALVGVANFINWNSGRRFFNNMSPDDRLDYERIFNRKNGGTSLRSDGKNMRDLTDDEKEVLAHLSRAALAYAKAEPTAAISPVGEFRSLIRAAQREITCRPGHESMAKWILPELKPHRCLEDYIAEIHGIPEAADDAGEEVV